MISSTGEACAPPPIRRPQRPRGHEEETHVARNCTREVQELPPRQQQMRADGGGEVEPEGQEQPREQPRSGAEERGLAEDWSDPTSARAPRQPPRLVAELAATAATSPASPTRAIDVGVARVRPRGGSRGEGERHVQIEVLREPAS